MLNNLDFANRMDRIFKFYDLSASAFADRIGVQRSSISHLMGGRNKPSLEFVMKVIEAFPEVDLHWLISGKGSFPAKTKPLAPIGMEGKENTAIDLRKESGINSKAIDKIIIFYSDGSFKAYSER